MLRAEAGWIGRALTGLPASAFPLLNMGSSTAHFRQVQQPWIDELVFMPLARSGRAVYHVDVRHAVGVDLVADITSAHDLDRLTAAPFSSVLCSNLLEHLPDPMLGVEALLRITRPGHTIVISGPRVFPPHPDPIDNGFRPTAREIVDCFGPHVVLRECGLVRDRLMLSLYADGARHGRLSVLGSLITPWRHPETWHTLARWTFRRATAVVAVMERVRSAQ